MLSFAIDTLVFVCSTVCSGVVFFTAFTTFFFSLTECCSMPKSMAFVTLVKVPLGCITLDFVFHAVNDKTSLDAFIGGILIFSIDFE